MKTFGGPVLFLDRSDINTDEIIPAKYLTAVTKEELRPHLLEDLKLADFDPRSGVLKSARVVLTRANFGCGSSREHAPWAFEVNGITTIVAQSYARIFRQNMFNCGMLAIEMPAETIDSLFALAKEKDVSCSVDLAKKNLTFSWGISGRREVPFTLNQFDEALVSAGGWVDYADAKY